VARVDLAVVALKSQVSPEDINEPFPSSDEYVEGDDLYSSEACHARVLFAWTRKPEHIKITKEMERKINMLAKDMTDAYSLDIPLVADIKIKLARISVSIACMMVSTDETNENIIVKESHIMYAYYWLKEMYKEFRYDTFSNRIMKDNGIDDNSIRRLEQLICKTHVAQALLDADKISDEVISDAFNVPFNEIGQYKEILKDCNALKEWSNRQKVKTTAFTRWLTEFVNSHRKKYDFFEEKENERSSTKVL